ncbi:MAG: 4-hydroxy-tetrahydrodipicolinate reductase [Acidimicrobiia bacterium]|nr:4-hydroxy-tetrahydrodipicolinate reductase [Acidimicrobiia bacterium]
MYKVGVLGAGGRMGAAVCEAVAADSDLDLVAAVDPHCTGLSAGDLVTVNEREVLLDAGAEVVVDFTIASAARDNLVWLASQNIHAVVGTTGFSDADLAQFQAAFEFANRACIIAPNFAISAVLMMRFAELAAPYFDTAEVVELHHDAKIDAPSGTARLTVEKMAAASTQWVPDSTVQELLPGARGAAGTAGIRVHSVRMRGMVAHHEVILGSQGQTLTIRQDSLDRSSFMPGVLAAVKAAPSHFGLIVGLESVLNI